MARKAPASSRTFRHAAMPNGPATTLVFLPTELLDLVVSYADGRTLANLAVASRLLRSISMQYLYRHVVLDTAAKILAFTATHGTSPRTSACTAHLLQVRSISISLLHGGRGSLRAAFPQLIGLCAEGMLRITAIQAPVDLLAELVNRRTPDELAPITHVSILDELDASLTLSRALWERHNATVDSAALLRSVAHGMPCVTHFHIGGTETLLWLPRARRERGFERVRHVAYEEPSVWENRPRILSRFNDVGALPAIFPALETMTARLPQESADRAFPTARRVVMERLAEWADGKLFVHDVRFDLGTCCIKTSKRMNLPLPDDAVAHSAIDAWKRHVSAIDDMWELCNLMQGHDDEEYDARELSGTKLKA